MYEILRLAATNLSNEEEYRQYRLTVKNRLNIPYKREQRDMEKLQNALKAMDKKSTSISLLADEPRIQALENEYRQLEEQYKKIVERLQKYSE